MTERNGSGKKPTTEPPSLIDVVDDDPSVARGLSRLLRSCGMQVRTFGSGEEFLRSRKTLQDPDCCVIDVQLPEMTGLEIQEDLHRSGSRVPIIFITAYYDEETERRALKAGAVGFLRKPFSDELLVGLILKALRKRKTLHG